MRKLSLSVLLLLLLLGIAAANTKSSLVNSLSKETHEDFIKALKSSDNLENNQDDILNSKMQVIIDRARVNYQLPALCVSVKLPEENSTRNYNSGYYSLSKKKKITADTLFQIGSITKTFAATIVLKLAEENKLALNDKIIKWLPQYRRWHEITIKNLLSHTSGVYNYTHGDNFDNKLRETPDKNWSLSELATMAYHHADLSKPSRNIDIQIRIMCC